MDKLKQIEAFVGAVDTGSLVRAALVAEVTPVMIGRRIDALERRLGARLLHRSTRRLVLTEQGAVYLEYCRKLLDDLDHADNLIYEGRHTPGRLCDTGLFSSQRRTTDARRSRAAQLPRVQPAGWPAGWMALPGRRQARHDPRFRHSRMQRQRVAASLDQRGAGHQLAVDLGDSGPARARRAGHRARRIRATRLRHHGGLSATAKRAG